jgi:hypothetical protein
LELLLAVGLLVLEHFLCGVDFSLEALRL